MDEDTSKVKDYMSSDVMTVGPEDTLEDSIMMIRKTFHDCFPVVKNGDIIGIITSWDIIQRRKSRRVKDIMTKAYQEGVLIESGGRRYNLTLSWENITSKTVPSYIQSDCDSLLSLGGI